MPPAPYPANEAQRLEALRRLDILDSEPSDGFNAFVEAASLICGTPIALICLVDEDRQWFKANIGLEGVTETPRDLAFCGYAILGDDILEVPDATTDPRFSDNALVQHDPKIRFYAGAPLRLADGSAIGTLCVIDRVGRKLDDNQRQILTCLALAAGKALEQHRSDIQLLALTAQLAVEHEMLQVTLRSIADGVITTDKHRRITWLNPVAERLTGWSVDDAIGLPLSDVFTIVDDRTRQAAAIPITGTFSRGEIVGITNNSLLLSRHGGESGIEASAAPICNEASEKLGLVVVFHDVTEQRHLHGEMSHRATHDTLTGLINRAEFTTRLECMLHRVQTDESQSALLFIDLDQFKPVNDSCGHAAGDELLILMANMLTEGARAGDTVARLGGDEFAILLDHCPIENAQIIAQKFCDRLDAFRFTYQTHRFRIGASIGLVPFDRRWSSIAAAMQAADASCYAAKEAGRGRVHTWFECDRTILARQGETKWSTLLAQALDEDAFVLFAQHIQKLGPKPGRHAGNIRDGLHGEVLLRLPADDGSLFLPGAFLPAAERFHIMPRIDRWVLAKIVDWMTRAPSLAHIDMLCVNLSGQSVGDLAFLGWAIATLTTAGPDICRRLCIEITETAAVTNFADARIFIEQLRAIGVRVALDDFGAGASSFGYLKTMPVDILKIDGQFVKNLMTDSLDESAIRCFVDVAATVGIKTIAEFVENTDVQNKLRAMGVDYGQGYLFHKPAPIDEVFANVVLIKSA